MHHAALASGRSRWAAAAAVLALLLPSRAFALSPTSDELALAGRFAERLGGAADQLPFSFIYGGRSSHELLPGWQRREQTESIDPYRQRREIVYQDPHSGLQVRCEAVQYLDFPTLEWTLYFHNAGGDDSPILEQVRALDAVWEGSGAGEYVLHHAAGSQANRSDYAPRQTPLPSEAQARFSAAGGRPTNTDWSYFNLQRGAEGLIVVVGWPGQWAGEFIRAGAAGVRIRAGQELVRTTLRAGEEIRSPLMVLQFWRGDRVRAQNLWRRWMMAHSMPRPGGQLPPPQLVASSSRAYEEMIKADEQNQIMHIDRYLEEGLKLDYWWMDAGWYIQQQGWPQVGTWEIDPQRFPRGFRPISEHAHARGVKILVWFEPERVMPGTWLYEQRPEWLLSRGQSRELAGMRGWSSRALGGSDPGVAHNPTAEVRSVASIRWEPGRLSFHPGPRGEYAVVRWTAPRAGEYSLRTVFLAIDQNTSTAVHVLHGGRPLYAGWINLQGGGPRAEFEDRIRMAAGQTLDFVAGWGNGSHICDSTGLEIRLIGPDETVYDAARDFHADDAAGSPWSYGYLPPAAAPDATGFHAFDRPVRPGEEGPRLLNLGLPAARQWLTEHVDRLLTEQGIDLYRQDFNIDPLAFWQAADPPDRQGITENKYICGYLAYWDELRRRHPAMLIDSCASGGRRNDLETMRRAVPLWRSDYAYEAIGHQCMTYGISLWLPYHGTGTVASAAAPYYGGGFTAVEPYAFWSNAAPSLGSGIDIRVREIDYAALRQLVQQWRELSRYYYGDFYPLTPYSQDDDQWIAWQWHDPESGAGAVQAFRRPRCGLEQLRLPLRDLAPLTTYTVALPDGESCRATGRELMEQGLTIRLRERPSAAVVLYRPAE